MSMAKALSQPKSRSVGRSEKEVTARPQARTIEVTISAGPMRTVARSTATAGSSPGRDFAPHAVEEMDRRTQAQAEGDRQSDDAGELQALPESRKQRAGADNRKNARQEGGQRDRQGSEGETNKSGDEQKLDRQSAAELVDHVRAAARRNRRQSSNRDLIAGIALTSRLELSIELVHDREEDRLRPCRARGRTRQWRFDRQR